MKGQKFSKIIIGSISLVFVAALQVSMLQPAFVHADSVPTTPTTPILPETPAPTPTPTPIEPTTPILPATPTPTPSPTPTGTPSDTTASTGPTQPTGAASGTYTLNKDTGLWENAHYTWDPATNQASPKDPIDYSYNPATGQWDTTQWIYNAASGKYEPNIISFASPPLSALDSGLASPLMANKSLSPMLSDNGPNLFGGSSNINGTNNNSGIFNLFYNASISNNIDSTAISGDASVSGNTNAGGATTGNARAMATLINMLNSSWGFAAYNPLIFVANILGNVLGDLFINPSAPNSTNTANNQVNNDIVVNDLNNNLINNVINLNATSGDAKVAGNTNAGSALSGNATAVANVMNLINSSIGAGQSFMGMINIYGNFNGDILLPSGALDSLLASNSQSGPNTLNSTNTTVNNNLASNTTTNTAILNDVNANAQSGQANVTKNTSAGSATTGASNTNITVLNMTGNQVIAKDALLVFINVLGRWVGMIVNAPSGTTAGMLGGGVTKNTTVNNNVALNSTTNNVINNTINANATSGDATVSGNTNAGNATTGNADVGVNLVNLTDSNLNLSDWFGVLFINVLGNWYGSFGVNTDAGNPINTPNVSNPANIRVFAFVPNQTGQSGAVSGQSIVADPLATTSSVSGSGNSTNVLGAVKPSNNKVSGAGNGVSLQRYIFGALAVALLAAAALYELRTKEFMLSPTTHL